MFITGLIFFSLLAGSFLIFNFAQFKRFRALTIADHDEETTRRFLEWQSVKLAALRWGQVGWITAFLTSLAVFPWVKTIVPLLAVAAFVVSAIKHDAAGRKLKRLPAHLSGQIKSQQGLFKFAWALPAVVFGAIALVGLQKVSHMIYSPKPVMAKAVEPKAAEKPAALDGKKVAPADQSAVADTAAEPKPAVPVTPAPVDPFAE